MNAPFVCSQEGCIAQRVFPERVSADAPWLLLSEGWWRHDVGGWICPQCASAEMLHEESETAV